MTAAVVLSACLGIMLGLQFRVLVVIPGAALAVAGAALLGRSSGVSAEALLGLMLVAVVTVQLGYVCGGMSRAFLKASPSEPAPARVSRPLRGYRPAR